MDAADRRGIPRLEPPTVEESRHRVVGGQLVLVVRAPDDQDEEEADDRRPPRDRDVDDREQPAEDDLGAERLPERRVEDAASSSRPSPSRRAIVIALRPTSMAHRTNAPPAAAASVASEGRAPSRGPAKRYGDDAADDGRKRHDRVVAERAEPGHLSGSRCSIVATAATQPAATGPPRAIAATMNGRWNVRTAWPP